MVKCESRQGPRDPPSLLHQIGRSDDRMHMHVQVYSTASKREQCTEYSVLKSTVYKYKYRYPVVTTEHASV